MQKDKIAENKLHIQWIDLLRCIAICCVILVHVTEGVYSIDIEHMMRMSMYRRLFVTACFTIGRLGVPIFLFISGYLLLDRDYDAEGCKRFWKKNLLGLFITTEIWIVIYSIFYSAFTHVQMNWGLMFRNMFFVADMPSFVSHFWYMFMILGIYLFVPFIASALSKFNCKILCFPFIVLFCFLLVVPVINVFLSSFGLSDIKFSPTLELSFGGGTFGLIFLTGYLFKKGMFRKIKTVFLIVAGVAAFICTIWLQIFAYNHGYQYNVWYNCAFLIISCICIFELISRKDQMKVPVWITNLAKCSFGIYLVHFPVRHLLIRYLHINSMSLKVAVICILTLVISWIIVWAMSHLRRVSKILFYYK